MSTVKKLPRELNADSMTLSISLTYQLSMLKVPNHKTVYELVAWRMKSRKQHQETMMALGHIRGTLTLTTSVMNLLTFDHFSKNPRIIEKA